MGKRLKKKNLNLYKIEQSNLVGNKAIEYAKRYLAAQPTHRNLESVEEVKKYQEEAIDLIWKYQHANHPERMMSIEVKGDTYYQSGNYFFETVSKEEEGKPGWMEYCNADFLFYYFLSNEGTKKKPVLRGVELHIIAFKKAQRWFWKEVNRFEERKVQTDPDLGKRYTTVGRLVQCALLKKEVGVKIIKHNPAWN